MLFVLYSSLNKESIDNHILESPGKCYGSSVCYRKEEYEHATRYNTNGIGAPIHDAESAWKPTKRIANNQSDAINSFASFLRLKLNIGDICPVCCICRIFCCVRYGISP
ncbi:MAG: hypothetical protein ACI4AH_03635 [Muribaculaceae bacterium]